MILICGNCTTKTRFNVTILASVSCAQIYYPVKIQQENYLHAAVLLGILIVLSTNQDIPRLSWISKVHYRFRKSPPLPLSWSSWIQSTPSYIISLISFQILSSHLHLVFPSGLFPSSFPTSTLNALLISPMRAKAPATSSDSGPNSALSSLFSGSLSFCTSLNMRTKRTFKIIVLYIWIVLVPELLFVCHKKWKSRDVFLSSGKKFNVMLGTVVTWKENGFAYIWNRDIFRYWIRYLELPQCVHNHTLWENKVSCLQYRGLSI